MKKIVHFVLFALVISALLGIFAYGSEIKLYDFKTSSLGWTVSNVTKTSFDGEHMNFSFSTTNPIMMHDFTSEKVLGADFPYIVCRAKVDNSVNTNDSSIKIYVKTLDKDGNVIDALWDGATISQSQLMKYSDNGKYVTYITDMRNVGHYMTSYLGSFVYGVGLYNANTSVSVDYLAFVPADKLNVNINFDAGTEDTVTGLPKNTTVTFGADFDSSLSSKPKREGYLFSGWSDTKDGSISNVFQNLMSDKTLYAVWRTDDTMKVTFIPNAFGETVTGMPQERTQSYDFGAGLVLPTGLERAGKSFMGWSTTPDGKNMVSDGTEVKSNMTLYAVWGQAKLLWEFNTDGQNEGWGIANGTYEIKDGLMSCVPKNYDPQLYSPELNVDTSIYTTLSITMSLTLPNGINSTLFQIFPSVDGSAYSESTCIKQTITASGLVTYTYDLTKSSIWKGGICTKLRIDASSSTGSTFKIDRIELISNGDGAVFEANGGTGKQGTIRAQNGTVTLPQSNFTRVGFEFDGWTADGVKVYKAGEEVAVSGVTSFYAVWKSLGGLDAETDIYYPGFTKKAFIMSYDDGDKDADTIMIKKLNDAALKGTFNLIANKFEGCTDAQKKELKALYEGQEVANHSYSHWEMTASATPFYTTEQCIEDMEKGREALEDIFGYKIRGVAWPYTNPNRAEITEYAEKNYLYARTAPVLGNGFDIPDSFSPNWKFTCIHANKGVVYFQDYLDKYLGLDSEQLTVYSLWGHSSQFASDNNWDLLDKFIYTYTNSEQNIWNPFVSDYVEYINASRSLVKTHNYIYNPSAVSLYVTVGGKEIILPSKALYDGKSVKSCTYIKNQNGCEYSFTADMENSDTVAIAAAYSADGRLLGAKIIRLENGIGAYSGSITAKEQVDNVRVYMFSDMDNIRPCGNIEMSEQTD